MPDQQTSSDSLQLVARFQAGDQSAFDELYRRYAARLVAFLSPKCLGPLDAFDVSQKVWVRVWQALPSFRNESFSGWIFAIARNLLKDEYKRPHLKAESLSEGFEPVTPIRKNPSISMDAMLDCLKMLKSPYVDAVQDTLDGLTTEEIADKHGIGTDNVDKWRFRGRNLIKDCVQQKLS